jgi:glycosyltransferase involved in cell wall biosynthesis
VTIAEISIAEMAIAEPRVCLVTDSREPSGLGRHMVDLARAFEGRVRLVLAAPDAPLAGGLIREFERLGAEIWALPDAGRDAQAEALEARLADRPVDLVHVHAGITWEGHEAARAARSAGTAAVVRTEHCPYVLTKAVDVQLYREGIEQVDRIVCVSEGVRDSFRQAGVPYDRMRVVRNGIGHRPPHLEPDRVRADLGVAVGAPLAVTVARLTEQKGHTDLLLALPRILRRVPEARFVWVGDGPLEAELRAGLERHGLSAHVTLIPGHPDVPALLAAADVVVLPSRFEGLPLVALEAMAAGRPVVGTAVVGLREAVRDGQTGRLVPAHDIDALADAVIQVLSDRPLAASWGRAGLAWQQAEFTSDRMAEDTMGIYAELLTRASAPRPLSMAAAR